MHLAERSKLELAPLIDLVRVMVVLFLVVAPVLTAHGLLRRPGTTATQEQR
jgi:biopolymer transport protein ExbD